MSLPSTWHVLCLLVVCALERGFALTGTSFGTNFTRWSEDDWSDTRFPITTKFVFNHQRYDHLIIRTRMNEWSLEMSYGNASRLNKIWTEFHLFLNDRASLANSTSSHLRHLCDPPVISPLTNDSSVSIPALVDMDERIAEYFIDDGFFRTINYIHCKIDERRRDPPLHVQLEIYVVTNREFQSLLYMSMTEETHRNLVERQARIYIQSHERGFRYNFNLSVVVRPVTGASAPAYMIKLYTPTVHKSSRAGRISARVALVVLFQMLCTLLARQ